MWGLLSFIAFVIALVLNIIHAAHVTDAVITGLIFLSLTVLEVPSPSPGRYFRTRP